MHKKLFLIFIAVIILSGCVYHYPPPHPLEFLKMKHCDIPAKYPYIRPHIYGVPTQYGCVRISPWNIVCGYDCKRSFDRVKCATFPGQTCIIGASGYIACGYDCKRAEYEVRCAWRYGDTCVPTAAGTVICGLNCRIVRGSVKCDESPSFYPEYAEKRT